MGTIFILWLATLLRLSQLILYIISYPSIQSPNPLPHPIPSITPHTNLAPKIPSLLLHIQKLIISGAGSDTTAISLRAMLYYMCKNPSTMRKLQKEIEEME